MGREPAVLGDPPRRRAVPDPGARPQPGRRRQPLGDELGVPGRWQRDRRRAVRGAPHAGGELARAPRDREPANPLVGGRHRHPPVASARQGLRRPAPGGSVQRAPGARPGRGPRSACARLLHRQPPGSRAGPHPAGRHPARAHPRLDQRRLRHRAGAVDHCRQLRQRRSRHPARLHRRPGPVDRSARRGQPRRHPPARRDRRRDPRRGGPSRRGRHGRRRRPRGPSRSIGPRPPRSTCRHRRPGRPAPSPSGGGSPTT